MLKILMACCWLQKLTCFSHVDLMSSLIKAANKGMFEGAEHISKLDPETADENPIYFTGKEYACDFIIP